MPKPGPASAQALDAQREAASTGPRAHGRPALAARADRERHPAAGVARPLAPDARRAQADGRAAHALALGRERRADRYPPAAPHADVAGSRARRAGRAARTCRAARATPGGPDAVGHPHDVEATRAVRVPDLAPLGH